MSLERVLAFRLDPGVDPPAVASAPGSDDCGCTHALQAAAVEPLDGPFPVPAYPPASWLNEKPDWLSPDTKIGVDDEGRVAGYFYHAGQCLVHDSSACPKPSPTGYSAFHQQNVVVDDGSVAWVGVIGNVNGHASPYARVDVAQAHYADPDRQLIVCRAYDDEHGGYILGAMVPHATYSDVALVRRSALSGDWRPMPPPWWQAHGITASVVRACEGYDCIGPTLVNRPGLPLVRKFGYNEAVNGKPRAAAILGGMGGIQIDGEQEPLMGTKVELPGGVTVTQDGPAPGPHPAVTAAAPQAPPAEQDAGPAEETEQVTLDDLAAAIQEIAGRLDQCEQAIASIMDTQMAAMEASAVPLPE